jgi:chemotaxis protein methyltransferase CheR
VSVSTIPRPTLQSAYRRLIEDRFGLRLMDHQARELERRVMEVLALTDFAEPLEMLRAFAAGWRADLLQVLVAGLTVGETHFFRIVPQIAALRELVLPDLIRQHAPERKLRVWSAGCSTGEEPYTLAILLREALLGIDTWDVQLFATDVSEPALDAARRGVYREWSFRDTPESIRRSYFEDAGHQQRRLVDSVRTMVRFSHQNLAQDPPPARPLDLILCRNVTIYFSEAATQRVYATFRDCLASDGWLVLGPSDPVPSQAGGLETVFAPGVVLWRKSTRPPGDASATLPTPGSVSQPPVQQDPHRRKPASSPLKPIVTGPIVERSTELADSRTAHGALEDAERIVIAEPLNASAHLLLGMLYLDRGAPDQALSSLRRAAFLEPRDPLVHFTLGRAWALAGQPERATAALLDARRNLGAFADNDLLPGGGGMWAGELRHAVDAQLATAA